MPVNLLAIAFPESGARTLREVVGQNIATTDGLYDKCREAWNDHLQGRSFVVATEGKFGLAEVTSIVNLPEECKVVLQLKNEYDVIYQQQRYLPIVGWTGTFAEGYEWVQDGKGNINLSYICSYCCIHTSILINNMFMICTCITFT